MTEARTVQAACGDLLLGRDADAGGNRQLYADCGAWLGCRGREMGQHASGFHLARPGCQLFPLAPPSDMTAADIHALVQQLCRQ